MTTEYRARNVWMSQQSNLALWLRWTFHRLKVWGR